MFHTFRRYFFSFFFIAEVPSPRARKRRRRSERNNLHCVALLTKLPSRCSPSILIRPPTSHRLPFFPPARALAAEPAIPSGNHSFCSPPALLPPLPPPPFCPTDPSASCAARLRSASALEAAISSGLTSSPRRIRAAISGVTASRFTFVSVEWGRRSEVFVER